MSTNFYLAYREALEAVENMENRNAAETLIVQKTHVAKRGGKHGWSFQAHRADTWNPVDVGEVIDVETWKKILRDLDDSLIILDEYGREVDPEDIISEWENDAHRFNNIGEFYSMYNSWSAYDNREDFLDEQGYLFHYREFS